MHLDRPAQYFSTQQTTIMEQDISTRPFDEREEDLGNEQILQNAQGETARNLDAGSLLKYYKEEAAAARREAAEEAYRKKQQGSNGNGEDGDTDRTISEDIYSLIYTANVCSQAFAFALFIFLLQELLLLLILYDLVDMRHYDSNNPLQLPAGVPLTVNVAQAISMILIVVTILCESADLTNGLLLLLDGYQPSILQKNPHATCLKWFCAGIFQCFAGSLMTIVLFILVMQSTTVISLALNFAALVRSHYAFFLPGERFQKHTIRSLNPCLLNPYRASFMKLITSLLPWESKDF